MSENIMYKNIADKMKKESIEVIRDSYDETMPKQEFERSLKYIEDYITDLQQELQRKDNITNKAINHIMNIFRDENWYENYDYDDLVSSLKDTLGILRGYKE